MKANDSGATDEVIVRFVGTGSPEMSTEREGIATLISDRNNHILIDAGRNLMQNIYESGVHPNEIDTLLLTHLHNDHIEGLPTLWMTGWFLLGRKHSLTIYGPVGTQSMVEGMYAMFQFDIKQRANRFNDPAHLKVQVHEIPNIEQEFELKGFQVTAFPVEHDDGDPSFGFRLERDKQTVMITGDTRLTSSVIKHGQKADLIISNVLAMPEELAAKPEMQEVIAKLMTIPEAVSLFNQTHPRLAAYNHLATKDLTGEIDAFIESSTRQSGYQGPLFIGKDGWSLGLKTLNPQPPPDPKTLMSLDRKPKYEDE